MFEEAQLPVCIELSSDVSVAVIHEVRKTWREKKPNRELRIYAKITWIGQASRHAPAIRHPA